jgi:hypothetical protein
MTFSDTHTFTYTLGRALDEGSARHRDLYLKKYNIHKKQTAMTSAGFEPAIAAKERPRGHRDRVDTL